MLEHQNYFASEWHLFPFTGELRLCLVCSTYTHFKNKHAVDHTFILAETHLCNNIMQTLYCFKKQPAKIFGLHKTAFKIWHLLWMLLWTLEMSFSWNRQWMARNIRARVWLHNWFCRVLCGYGIYNEYTNHLNPEHAIHVLQSSQVWSFR